MDLKFSPELELAKKLAVQAGSLTMEYFGKASTGYELKGRADFVTLADKKAEELIVAGIREAFPSHSVLGEEGASFEGTTSVKWLIDPLDGTGNFANGIPIFATSIGIEREGKTHGGAVFFPVTSELFYAEQGKGAYLNGARIAVNKSRKFPELVSVFGLTRMREKLPKTFKDIEFFALNGQYVMTPRSICFNFCALAAGRVDAAIGVSGSPWDFAASKVILEEAGGLIKAYDGGTFDIYSDCGYVAATGGENLAKIVHALKEL